MTRGVVESELARAVVGDDDAAIIQAQDAGDPEELLMRLAFDGADGDDGSVGDSPRIDRAPGGLDVLDDPDARAVANDHAVARAVGGAAGGEGEGGGGGSGEDRGGGGQCVSPRGDPGSNP